MPPIGKHGIAHVDGGSVTSGTVTMIRPALLGVDVVHDRAAVLAVVLRHTATFGPRATWALRLSVNRCFSSPGLSEVVTLFTAYSPS